MNNNKTSMPIKKSSIYILIAILTLLIATASYFYYKSQENSIRQEKYNELKAIADLKVSQIEDWLDDRKTDAKVFPQSPFFVDAVALWLQDTTNLKLKDDITTRLKPLQEGYAYEDIFLAATNGQSLLSAKGRTAIHDSIIVQKIIEASVKKEIVFTDFYFSTQDNQVHFDIITPVINSENKTIAVLILRRNPNDFLYPLIQSWPLPSKSAETALLRIENDSVIFLNELRHLKNTALKLKIPLTRKDEPSVQAALGRTGLFEGIDYRGVKVLSDIRIIPGVNWIMLSKVDKSEIYSDLYVTAGITAGFTILLILICGISLAFYYNSRQKNIFRELYGKEKELWGQQEKFKVTMDSLGEGVITLDVKGKLQYMNNLAEEMTGWNLREARGRELGAVYALKNEETGQRENNILDKIYKHGIVKELANHTLLITKSGKEIPVMDTGSPIYDNDGTVIGIVIAFQDETEKRTQKRQLEESERRYRLLVDTIPDTSILVFDSDHRFLVAGGEEISKSGFDRNLVEGRTLSEAYPPDVEKLFAPLYNKALKGESTVFEHQYGDLHYHQQILPLLDSNGNIFAGMVISRNITARKLAEEERKELYQRIEKIADLIPGMIYQYRLNPDGTSCFPWSSAGTTKIYGVKPEDVERDATPVFNVLHPDDIERVSKTINGSAKNLTIWNDEYRVNLPNGKTIWVEGTATPQKQEDDSILWHGAILDITARKLAEEKIIQSEFKLIEAQRIAKLGNWELNLSTNYLTWSDEIYSIFEIDKEKFGPSYDAFLDAVHPEDRDTVNNAYTDSIKNRTPYSLDHRLLLKDGRIKFVQEQCENFYDENGNPIKSIGTVHDITERKLAEEEIKESRSRLQRIFETMTDGLVVIDSQGRFIQCNPAALSILGLTEDQFMGRTATDPRWKSFREDGTDFPFEEQPGIVALRTGKKKSDVINLELTSGEHRWISVKANPFNSKGKSGDEEPSERNVLVTFVDITARKLAEEKLSESNERFNKLVSELNEVVWTASVDGSEIVDVNDSFERVYGISLDQFKANPKLWIEMVHPDDKQIAETSSKELFEKGKTQAEYRIVKPDGTIVWLLDRKSIIHDENGNPIQMGGIAKDITERKQNENFLVTQRNLGITTSALTNLEELYPVSMESLFNISGMDCGMIYLFDGEQKKLDMVFSEGLSEQFVSVTSHYDEHSDNVKFVKLGNPALVNYNELPVELSEIERAEKLVSVAILPILNKGKVIGCINLASHQSISMPVSIQKGIEVIVTLISNAIIRINAEDEIKNLNVSLEIKIEERTEQLAETNRNLYREIEIRTKAYEEIDRLYEQMDYIFGATKTGLSIVDEDYNLYHVSPAQQKIYGDFSGKKCYEYFKGFDKPCEECLVEKAIETQTSAVYETTLPRENNRAVQATCIPFIDLNGKQFVAEVTADITERKKFEQLLAQAKTEAEQANAVKSEFLSLMSHELRTPLNSILGFAQLLNRRETNPESKKRIDQIMKSGRHLLDLINEVLDIARIESGKLSLSLEPVQLSGIIMEALDIVHPIAEKREIKLKLADSPVNDLFVKSDRQKLKQVMLNFFNNAVKYNRKGGEVEVSITQTGNSIRISVRDTGIGIAPEELHKLFEPFQRIGSEISEVEGTGLGLAVAKKLVEALNGIIGVESVVGIGSTFWIELPQTISQLEHTTQTHKSAKPETVITRSRGTILYIEDNISNIQLVEDILGAERPNVRLVTEMYGKNAVKIAADYKPDLILLDLDLPDIHGSEVLTLLQIDTATKSIPVVVLSADAVAYTIEQLLAAGARHYLTKPLDVDKFLEVIDEIMNNG